MIAMHLDHMTWAEVKAEIKNGRDTVIVPFDSTEQHGRHMPLGTDAVLGDEFGWVTPAWQRPRQVKGTSRTWLSFFIGG
jgi:hypothetical protein